MGHPVYSILKVKKNPDSWLYTVEKREGKVGQAISAVNKLADGAKNFKLF